MRTSLCGYVWECVDFPTGPPFDEGWVIRMETPRKTGRLVIHHVKKKNWVRASVRVHVLCSTHVLYTFSNSLYVHVCPYAYLCGTQTYASILSVCVCACCIYSMCSAACFGLFLFIFLQSESGYMHNQRRATGELLTPLIQCAGERSSFLAAHPPNPHSYQPSREKNNTNDIMQHGGKSPRVLCRFDWSDLIIFLSDVSTPSRQESATHSAAERTSSKDIRGWEE